MGDALTAARLLVLSNLFMTAAWYGHLRFPQLRLPVVVLASWGIALFEYVLQVPANRIGFRALSAYQLKVLQEAISLSVFMALAFWWLGEVPSLRYGVAFGLIVAAVAVAFH